LDVCVGFWCNHVQPQPTEAVEIHTREGLREALELREAHYADVPPQTPQHASAVARVERRLRPQQVHLIEPLWLSLEQHFELHLDPRRAA
jgi:hypothetical protein